MGCLNCLEAIIENNWDCISQIDKKEAWKNIKTKSKNICMAKKLDNFEQKLYFWNEENEEKGTRKIIGFTWHREVRDNKYNSKLLRVLKC